MSLPVDLFFTQTIDCHCDEESGHDPDCDFANECDVTGLISPRRKSSQAEIDYYDLDTGDEDAENRNTKVRFHEFMKVVLIPTKEEYKKANCDLWWKRTDFMSFQKNAHSELRLFSMIQNVNVQEAKQQLYQPISEDLVSSSVVAPIEHDVQQMMEENHDDPYFELSQTNQIFRTRTDSEESVEERKQKQKEEEILIKAVEDGTVEKERVRTASEELHEPLNLCVPISDPVPASNNSRMSKYRNTIASAGILAAMGLFSFAAPILGFYFLSSQR